MADPADTDVVSAVQYQPVVHDQISSFSCFRLWIRDFLLDSHLDIQPGVLWGNQKVHTLVMEVASKCDSVVGVSPGKEQR